MNTSDKYTISAITVLFAIATWPYLLAQNIKYFPIRAISIIITVIWLCFAGVFIAVIGVWAILIGRAYAKTKKQKWSKTNKL